MVLAVRVNVRHCRSRQSGRAGQPEPPESGRVAAARVAGPLHRVCVVFGPYPRDSQRPPAQARALPLHRRCTRVPGRSALRSPGLSGAPPGPCDQAPRRPGQRCSSAGQSERPGDGWSCRRGALALLEPFLPAAPTVRRVGTSVAKHVGTTGVIGTVTSVRHAEPRWSCWYPGFMTRCMARAIKQSQASSAVLRERPVCVSVGGTQLWHHVLTWCLNAGGGCEACCHGHMWSCLVPAFVYTDGSKALDGSIVAPTNSRMVPTRSTLRFSGGRRRWRSPRRGCRALLQVGWTEMHPLEDRTRWPC